MKTSSLFTFSALMLAVPAVALAQAGSATGQGSMGSSGQTGASDTATPGGTSGSGSMTGSSTGSSMGGAGKMNQAQAQELLGADVKNAQNETIGEVEAVQVDSSGMVSNIIVSVGGFLGIGSRDVALSWNDLQVADNGQAITTTMTKEQLKNMPEYQYSDSAQKGKVFSAGGSGTMGGSDSQSGGARSGGSMQKQ